MVYIHICDNFGKIIDDFHEFKRRHSDDIVTTNYDSATKTIYIKLDNGDLHNFMNRSSKLIYERLSELGCTNYVISESDINDASLITVDTRAVDPIVICSFKS